MGNIVEELLDGHRLVTTVQETDKYYIVTSQWGVCTETFDEVVDVEPNHVTFRRGDNEYNAVYDGYRWQQTCTATDDQLLYCEHVYCQRHPAYNTHLVDVLPDLQADEYDDWTPPLLARLKLLYLRVF